MDLSRRERKIIIFVDYDNSREISDFKKNAQQPLSLWERLSEG
jgi:hypothetical protein